MKKLTDFFGFFRRNYSDILGMDVGASGTKVVRLSRTGAQVKVTGVDILPAMSVATANGTAPAPLVLPKPLKSRYVALATSSQGAQVKLLTVPAHSDKTIDVQVNELMGFGGEGGGGDDIRVGYERVQETRTEVRILAVVLPDAAARGMCSLFPEGTIPAPCSVEVSGLASMTAFLQGPGAQHLEDCVAVIDFGAAVTVIALFNKGSMVLVRKLDFGAVNILKKLQDSLGVDQDVAVGILSDGSFDVSKIFHQSMESFLQQLTISLDFVERRENVHVEKLYVCGGGAMLRLWSQEVENATGRKPILWNPFEGMALQPGVYPDRLKGQEGRFTAAIGAALAMVRAS